MTSGLNVGTGVQFLPSELISVFPDVPPASVLEFDQSASGIPRFAFVLGAFTAVGTYQSFLPVELSAFGSGTLTVSTASNAAPEPASIGLIASGALVGLFAIRRRATV